MAPHYEKEPYQFMACHGDHVQLKSPQGVQYKRNIKHVKQFVTLLKSHRVQGVQTYLVNKCVDKNSHPVRRWELRQRQLGIRALSSNSCYEGDQGKSPDLLRDSVTMSAPDGGCGVPVALTLSMLYLQLSAYMIRGC